MAGIPPAPTVWVFDGARRNSPSAVFTTKELAEAWISENEVTGTLTRYPLDPGVCQWAVERGKCTPLAQAADEFRATRRLRQ